MTEVRVHAAFKVKDEATFLKEAAKVVEATQVKLNMFNLFFRVENVLYLRNMIHTREKFGQDAAV